MPSSIAGARRSSTTSERTLVDTSSRQVDASDKEQVKDYDRKLSIDAGSTNSQGSSSSRQSIMGKAIKKVKSKLGDKSSSSTAESKPRKPVADSYPDTVYMWRALAETKM